MATYWRRKNNQISFLSTQLRKIFEEQKIIIVDGGAAGELFEPFNTLGRFVEAYRFEPRGEEAVTLANTHYIHSGLWSESGVMKLHLAKEPERSSICPPNKDYLATFHKVNGWPPRATQNVVEIDVVSIDDAVAKNQMPLPNFIKLDVHSAEYPAILGSKKSLSDCIGFLVETWHSEVHEKQGLHCDVEKELIALGYTVYDNICAASWRHEFDGSVSMSDRPQYVGSEMLFLKRTVSDHLLLKQIMLLELFGFGNAAKQIAHRNKNFLGDSSSKEIIEGITRCQKKNEKNIGFKFTQLAIAIGRMLRKKGLV